MRILVIEDDQTIATNIKLLLVKSGAFAVDIAQDGQTGIDKSLSENYDLAILDWLLPDIQGPKVLKILRHENIHTPILMLTAKSQPEDVVEGLDSGADDYLPKPFRKEELLARVRALLRRRRTTLTNPIIKIADLEIDTNTCRVTRSGDILPLSPKEYSLLEYLARNQSIAVDRLDILSHVWDENTDSFSNTVDVHIRYLRRKIDTHHTPKLIHTVKGRGYCLCAKPPLPPKSHS